MNPTIHDHALSSQAVNRTLPVKIITPPDYNPTTLYPVLYFLHPWGLSPRYIIDKLNIHRHAWNGTTTSTLPPMVIVLPTGERSFFMNAADPPGHDWTAILQSNEQFFQNALEQYGPFGEYLLDEVIPFVEENYAVRRDRGGRAIGGISMGGAAAAVHAFRDPAQFCAVGIHSPALFPGPPEHAGPPWIFGLDRSSFAARNPADVAQTLDPAASPRIYLDTGDSDPMAHEVERLHNVLESHAIPHQYHMRPGEHNKTYWEPHMREYLAFYAQGWR